MPAEKVLYLLFLGRVCLSRKVLALSETDALRFGGVFLDFEACFEAGGLTGSRSMMKDFCSEPPVADGRIVTTSSHASSFQGERETILFGDYL